MKELELEQADLVIDQLKNTLDFMPQADIIKLKALASLARLYTFGKGLSHEETGRALEASVNSFDIHEDNFKKSRVSLTADEFEKMRDLFEEYTFKFFIRHVRAFEDGLALLAIMFIKILAHMPNKEAVFESSVEAMRTKLKEWDDESGKS